MADGQADAGDGGHLAEIFRRPVRDLMRRRFVAQPAAAQAARQLAGVDADRTGGGAKTAAGAGVEAEVGKILADVGGLFAGGGPA